jgi:hypothetical protein
MQQLSADWSDAGEPTLWGKDTLRQTLYVACGKWEDTMPYAWRGSRIRYAAREIKCGQAGVLRTRSQGSATENT